MQARIPALSYLAVGFGPSMRGTDMIVWRWKNEELVIDNLWSDGYKEPPSDGTDFLTSFIEDSADGRFKIIETTRKLDTGNAKDFVIQPDVDYVWSYAFKAGRGDFVNHGDNRDNFSIKFSSTGEASVSTEIDLTEFRRNSFYEAHGWWMWSAWMPVGILLLITKRYAKKHWNCMHVMHALLGVAVLGVTLVWGFKIMDYFEW